MSRPSVPLVPDARTPKRPTALTFKYIPVRGAADSIRLLISEINSKEMIPRINCIESVEAMQRLQQATVDDVRRGVAGKSNSFAVRGSGEPGKPTPLAKAMFTSFVPTLEVWYGPRSTVASVDVYDVEPGQTIAPRGPPDEILQHGRIVYRYLAEVYGYLGRNEEETATVDMIVEECDVIRQDLLSQDFVRFADCLTDFAVKSLQMDWTEEFLVRELVDLSTVLTANDSTCTHFVGTTITTADVSVYSLMSLLESKVPTALPSFPALTTFMKRIAARPSVKACVRY